MLFVFSPCHLKLFIKPKTVHKEIKQLTIILLRLNLRTPKYLNFIF